MSVDHFSPPLTDAQAELAQRRAARESFFLQAQITALANGRQFAVRVRNLSAGGMMADCDRPLETGDRLTVELRGVERVQGVVAWVGSGKFGVSFDSPIDPQAARKPVVRPLAPREKPASHVARLFNARLGSS